MTKEEAIDTLNAMKAMLKIYPKRKKQKESVSQLTTALDMAIKSLSKPSGDLISRKNAIDVIEKQFFGGTVADINPSWKRLHDIINALPTVDIPYKAVAEVKVDTEEIIKRIKEEYNIVERPQGEWKHTATEITMESYHHIWECTNCGSEGNPDMNYCPNCGAKMEK